MMRSAIWATTARSWRDVEGGGAVLADALPDRGQHLDLGRDVERRRRLVEDDQVGPAGHRHRGHGALQLAARDLVRIAFEPKRSGSGSSQLAVEAGGLAARPRPGHRGRGAARISATCWSMVLRRVEGGGRALGDVGDAAAAEPRMRRRSAGRGDRCRRTRCGRRRCGSRAGVAHRGEADGRLAGARLADQAQHLAALQRERRRRRRCAATRRRDASASMTRSLISQQAARSSTDLAARTVAAGRRNQSTTKLTPTVRSAIAAAGISGAERPKLIACAFSRTMPPQSALGGWMPRPEEAQRRDEQEDEAEAQAELGHERRQRVRQDLAGDDPAQPLAAQARRLDEVRARRCSCASARARRKTRVESRTAMIRIEDRDRGAEHVSTISAKISIGIAIRTSTDPAQDLVEPAADDRGGRSPARCRW